MVETNQTLIDRIWQILNVPESCLLDSRIYKKMLLENADLVTRDKKLVNEAIESLLWRYTLKPETINIPAHQTKELDYPEIAIILVSLKTDKQTKRLIEIIQRAIPYPLLLIMTIDDRVWVSLANKRQSFADSVKLTIDHFFDSEWMDGGKLQPIEDQFIESLNNKDFDWTNIYTFYQSLVDRSLALQAARYTGEYLIKKQTNQTEEISDSAKRQSRLADIRKIEEEENQLKAELKKETQFNRKLNLNMRIKECQKKIKQLTNNL